VIAVTGSSRDTATAGCGDRRPGLSQGGESNSSAHQALPNRAHGALPVHHQISLTRAFTMGAGDGNRTRTISLGSREVTPGYIPELLAVWIDCGDPLITLINGPANDPAILV
jgi:hypothetical protein